ncbi:MAG: ECF transporter S component [Clostridia bacterium]|nr:ECF transporter S component [Clostridia bacterium]
MNNSRFFSAKNVATLGVLLALVIVLSVFGGTINIGTVSLNFSLIPIVLGALVLGPLAGGILGFANGAVVLFQVITGAGFYAVIWQNSPVVTVLVCLLKTTLAGVLAGFIYRAIAKKNGLVATFVASGLVPVINTGIFVLGCLCMSNAVSIFQSSLPAEAGFEGMNVMLFILVGLVTFNFFFEFAINLLLAPALHRVYTVVEKQFIK